MLLTFDLVGDVLLGCDDLIHICSYESFQRGARSFTFVHHSFILALTLALHHPIHRICDLHTEHTQLKDYTPVTAVLVLNWPKSGHDPL